MYTCKDSIELLRAFLDGDLPAEEEQHLHEHLSACPPCVDFLRTYQATPQLCQRALGKQMPLEMSVKLTDFLRERCKK
jgi:anti-sigma factor RsiW